MFLLGVACQLVYFFAMGSLEQSILTTFALGIITIYAMQYAEGRRDFAGMLAVVGALALDAVACLALPALLAHTDYLVDYGFWGVLLALSAACAFILMRQYGTELVVPNCIIAGIIAGSACGCVMAGGYSGMLESPKSAENAQCTIYYRADSYLADGDTVTLLDADGNVLLEYSFAHAFNAVILSSPDLAVGQTYTLMLGDQSVEIEMTDTIFSNRSSRGGFGGSREMSGEPETEETAEQN